MSEVNVEIVRRVYEAFNRRDWEAMFRDAHPNFEMTTQLGPDAGTRLGRERVMEFAEDYMAAFDKLTWEPAEFFEVGDQVVVFVKVRSRPRGGGVDLLVRNGHSWMIRDGVILSMTSFPEPEKALEAAGPRA